MGSKTASRRKLKRNFIPLNGMCISDSKKGQVGVYKYNRHMDQFLLIQARDLLIEKLSESEPSETFLPTRSFCKRIKLSLDKAYIVPSLIMSLETTAL